MAGARAGWRLLTNFLGCLVSLLQSVFYLRQPAQLVLWFPFIFGLATLRFGSLLQLLPCSSHSVVSAQPCMPLVPLLVP